MAYKKEIAVMLMCLNNLASEVLGRYSEEFVIKRSLYMTVEYVGLSARIK